MPNVKDLLFTNNKKVTHIADENYNVQTLSYQIKANNFGTIRIPSLVVTISNQSRDAFGNFLYGGWNAQQKKIFSNALMG
jgi:hypothetical protein